MNLPLRILDGIGPFFVGHPRGRINWSKIPFWRFELGADGEGGGVDGSGLDEEALEVVVHQFSRFAERAASLGFTHLTLDDLAHLYDWPGYRPALRRRIAAYRRHFARLFEIAEHYGLRILLTSDVLSYTPELERELGRRPRRIGRWLRDACGTLLDDYPQIDGIILRVGESDGVDVQGEFRSRLVLRSPRHLRGLIERLLPTFEDRGRLLIVRTWSVGAYHLGDLIWHRGTFRSTFAGLDSDALVLSMKYGESDFFRYLPLNAHFFRSGHKKILELQARREYEGFGEYPSFVGWLHEEHRAQLAAAENLVGFSVWCQTGGWSRFRRLTYVGDESFWIELNVETCMAIFGRGESVAEALRSFCARRGTEGSARRAAALAELLRYGEAAILDLLYLREFAEQKLFFRRLRMPPLISVFWDNVLVNHTVRQLLRALVRDGERAIYEGDQGLAAIRRMIDLAPEAGAPVEDLVFMLDTFEILAVARRYYFREYRPEIARRLERLRARYETRYGGAAGERYQIHLDFRPVRWKSGQVRRAMGLLLRRERGYRWLDRVVTLRLLRLARPAVRLASRRVAPRTLSETAMGVDSVLL
ncbi:MAG: hypothetical protein DWQ36_25270 [Acidobacteria bacterium]|nr:MAG: hypothetical protein DWQ30_02120 [Acidobacteriota bacterium]REJ99530.1 MAG: hypothetical protein DWQ36_25270 [Acidobacteriota bacterium]